MVCVCVSNSGGWGGGVAACTQLGGLVTSGRDFGPATCGFSDVVSTATVRGGPTKREALSNTTVKPYRGLINNTDLISQTFSSRDESTKGEMRLLNSPGMSSFAFTPP